MRAQGLPLNTIVLGALAVLVLVLLAAAFIPGAGDFLQALFMSTPNDVGMCTSLCNQLGWQYQTGAALTTAVKNQDFCIQYNCSSLIQCTVILSDGSSFTMPSTTCI